MTLGAFSHSARTARAQRAHSASYYGVYPGNSPENLPPLEACMSNSKLRNSNVLCSRNYPTSKTSHSITSFQSSELTELSPPFKIFTVAASCLPASRDRCVVLGGILALRAHCTLLLDYVPPEEPPGTPLGNNLRIRQPKLDWRGPLGGPSRFL